MAYKKEKRTWFETGDLVVDQHGKQWIFYVSQGLGMAQCHDPKDGVLHGVELPLHFAPDFDPGETMVSE